ncbi:MAG: PilZ domain-containing protein [Oligoflexales bacterium]|nr:PilZ domain-containing protein [Oligoflexales bacterium]
MPKPKKKKFKNERRLYNRFALRGTLPGDLRDKNGNRLDIVTVDVSSNGMGLLIDPAPKIGDMLSLSMTKDGQPIDLIFKVEWIQPAAGLVDIPGVEDAKRCGVLLKNDGINLLELLSGFNSVHIEE